MRSYKNLASGFARPRSVTCVHKPWHLEWNTPGSPGRYAGIFGGLLSKHCRYQAFKFFEVESGIRSQVGSKIGKMPNGPNRKLNRLTKKKNFTYLVPYWIITWADWCGATFALATNLFTRITVQRKFNSPYAISDQTSLLYANFVPTLISPTLYGLLYSAVMFLQQRTKDTRTNNPIDQSVDMCSARRFCCCKWLGVAPKMKKVRPAN